MIWYFLRHLTWSLFLLTFVFTFNCEGQFHQIFARWKLSYHFSHKIGEFPSCASVEIFRSAFLKELLLSFILFSSFYLIHFSYCWLYTVYYYFCEFFEMLLVFFSPVLIAAFMFSQNREIFVGLGFARNCAHFRLVCECNFLLLP